MTDSKENALLALSKSISAHQDAVQKRNSNALRHASTNLKFAEELFSYLAYAPKHYKTNSVAYLQRHCEADYYDLVKLLKFLDEQSFGEFVVGRKGNESRISWKFHPKDIGRVALSKAEFLKGVPKKLDDYDGGEAFSLDEVTHSFHLRPDYHLQVNLPSDFDSLDAERLKKWLDTIPFD